MSWLSNLTGIHLGNIGAPIGAALGSFIPGVGTALGAGLGQAIGGLGSGKSLGTATGQGLAAYGGAKAIGGLAGLLGGSGSQQGAAGGGVAVDENGNPIGGTAGGYGDGTGNSSPISLQGILKAATGGSGQGQQGGVLGDIGSFLSNNKGLISGGLGAAQALNAANLQKQSTNYATQADTQAHQSYDQRAPLRMAGIAGMLNPTSGVDLSALKGAAGRGNPFAGPIPLRGVS